MADILTYPWKVGDSARKGLSLSPVFSEIRKNLPWDVGIAQEVIESRPPEGLMKSIALPTLMAMRMSKDFSFSGRNPLEGNSGLKAWIAKQYGLSSGHKMLAHFAQSHDQIERLCGWFAGTFAYSTLLVPRVIPFPVLVREINAAWGDDSDTIAAAKRTGMLVLTGAFSKAKLLDRVTGEVQHIARKRMAEGKLTVLIDVAPSSLARILADRIKPKRIDFVKAFEDGPLFGVQELCSIWTGPHVYFAVNGDPLKEVNDCECWNSFSA